MKAREYIKTQSSRWNWSILLWIALFAGAVVALSLTESLGWTWLAFAICLTGLLLTTVTAVPKCPFCDRSSLGFRHGVIGNYCDSCGHALDKEIQPKTPVTKSAV